MNNSSKTVLFLSALTGLFVFVGLFLGGPNGAILAFMLATGINFFSYWFSDKIVLSMYGAHELRENELPNIHSMVKRLSEKAGIPTPKIFLAPLMQPNAFATGRSPEHGAICFTYGILQALDAEELKGVIAHELSHIKNRDILVSSIAATFAGALMLFARLAFYGGMFFPGRDKNNTAGSILSFILLAIATPVIALMLQLAISRQREFMADQSSVKITGSPTGLMNALVKLEQYSLAIPLSQDNSSKAAAHLFIVNPFKTGFLAGLLSTHPTLQKRLEKLQKYE